MLRSAVYDTCFAVRTCDGLYHFIFSIDRVGISFGFQTIIWTFARHLVSRCLYFPATGITYGSTWVVLWLLFCRSAPSTFPNKRSTLQGPFRGVPSPLDYTQKLTISTLALKLSVSAIYYPPVTATPPYLVLRSIVKGWGQKYIQKSLICY